LKYEDVFEAIGILEVWQLQQDERAWWVGRDPEGFRILLSVGLFPDVRTVCADVGDRGHAGLVPVVRELIERMR
jgi:hypothetical protein